ncbi:MAG: hypothetical protein WC375_03000 [Methanomassiliicoccales archaeon]
MELLGRNREKVIYALQDAVLKLLGSPRTDVLLDWTSIVYYGDMAKLAKHGYSRDHHPEERQFTLGAAQLAPPYDVPIGLTVEAGNVNDQAHMKVTYGQVSRLLSPGSLVVFDRGANDKDNLDWIGLDRNDYLTAKKLNASDDPIFDSFSKTAWECIDADAGVYALKKAFPSRVNYYFFSEKLKKEHLKSRRRKAERLLAEAISIQNSLDKGKKLPKRFRINNPLVEVKYDYQTKLVGMDEEEALRLLLEDVIDGREGCFCPTFFGSVAYLPQQGRDREALSFAEERDRDQAGPGLDGGRRSRRPYDRFHRAADDQLDTLFRKASEAHVNEIHHRIAAKFDRNGGFDGQRTEKEVLLELQRGQQGHFGKFSRRNLVETPGFGRFERLTSL